MRIAIFGAGFIGKHLLNSYLLAGYPVRVFDHNPCPVAFAGRAAWTNGSLGDLEAMRVAVKGADAVFHLISSTVPRDATDENEEILSNVVQTINLLKLCVQERVGRVIFISSASVYGIKNALPINENATTDPISSHGIHKLMIEKYLQLYRHQFGLDCKIIRLSNPYGYGQNVFGRQGVIAIAIGKILTGQSINILGDGRAIRDFLHIDDVVTACRLAANTTSDEVVFNVGSGQGLSVNQVLAELQNLARENLALIHGGGQKADISASILDIQKARIVLGFEPTLSFKEGLSRTIFSYIEDFPESESRFNMVALNLLAQNRTGCRC